MTALEGKSLDGETFTEMTDTGGTSSIKISKRVEKELHQNKVIIRGLPPNITEDKLKELINPFPEHTYFYLSPGDHTLGPPEYSRAYIAFENEEEIVSFWNQYDGMMLGSEKGVKYRAIVEFAPYQGVPKKPKRKLDARCGTIEQDSDFQAFMQSLETQPESRPSVNLETYLEELEANKIKDVQVTPLIEYLRDRMSGRGGRARGRVDVKKKRKGETSSSKSKSYKSGKSGATDTSAASSAKGSKSREASSKGKKEKKESESIDRTGSSTKLSSGAKDDGDSQSKSRTSHKSGPVAEGRQERKEKYHGGSERKENGHEADASGEKETRRGKQRNRDRPDRSIYVPRGRDQGGGDRDVKESSRDYHGRGGRGKQGRYDESNDYGGRPRSRGRGRGYRRSSDQAHESSYQDK